MTEYQHPTKETNILLDTVVISYFIKADTRSDFYRKYVSTCTKCLSFISIAELYYWAYSKDWASKRRSQANQPRSLIITPFSQTES
jgi:predicted nucleic acid-binding protein